MTLSTYLNTEIRMVYFDGNMESNIPTYKTVTQIPQHVHGSKLLLFVILIDSL